jgi:branched-chain amino acid aminotransferase
MLTQKSTPAEASSPEAPAADPHAASSQRDLGGVITYFEGSFVPLRDAKVSVMTHAFMYGTATFEGIRGYWNAEHGKLYVL